MANHGFKYEMNNYINIWWALWLLTCKDYNRNAPMLERIWARSGNLFANTMTATTIHYI